jgi:DnaJ-class molecular chaperone
MNNEKFKNIMVAYEILGDKGRREEYDILILHSKMGGVGSVLTGKDALL